MKGKKRKKKFVVWLHNKTWFRDDEWVTVWAHTRKKAQEMGVEFDKYRFNRGHVLTAAEFRKQMGIAA